MVQQLRIHLAVQGTWVPSLVRKLDRTCCNKSLHATTKKKIPRAPTKTWHSQINRHKFFFLNNKTLGTSLTIQRLRLHTCAVGGMGSIPYATQHGQKLFFLIKEQDIGWMVDPGQASRHVRVQTGRLTLTLFQVL